MNLKKQITTGAFILFAATAFAQEINKEQLNQIQNSFVKDQNTIALQNLLSNDKGQMKRLESNCSISI